MSALGHLKIVSQLLDLPIIDKDERSCGIVDDVELEGRPGKEMKVAALLVGPGAYDGRMPAWLLWLTRQIAGDRMARVPADATAYAHRSKPMLVNVAAFYQGEADRETRRTWVMEFAKRLQPNDDSAYVGFLTDDGEARIRGAYPGSTWYRLVKIKSTYDPTNLFRLNQNIRPPGS